VELGRSSLWFAGFGKDKCTLKVHDMMIGTPDMKVIEFAMTRKKHQGSQEPKLPAFGVRRVRAQALTNSAAKAGSFAG
jgi:hypothetical protein